MAGLGFADDLTKLRKRRSLGVSGRTKLAVPGGDRDRALAGRHQVRAHQDTLELRIFDASVDLGLAYPVLIFLVLAGATNGVNLTDGLDGLAAGCAAIVFLTYTAMTFITGHTGVQDDLALLSACLVGACVGFLWFNSFPASIFMGDTGSLGLGGAIAGLAVMTKTEVLLILIGGIFVIEALSVAIQVISFQRFRRRVFLMAPIHHHFELMGWSETKIIVRFWIVAAICSRDRLHALPAVDHSVSPRAERPPLPAGPYLVVGLARSGVAAARMLRAHGERDRHRQRPPRRAGRPRGRARRRRARPARPRRLRRQEPRRPRRGARDRRRARARAARARRARARPGGCCPTSSWP